MARTHADILRAEIVSDEISRCGFSRSLAAELDAEEARGLTGGVR